MMNTECDGEVIFSPLCRFASDPVVSIFKFTDPSDPIMDGAGDELNIVQPNYECLTEVQYLSPTISMPIKNDTGIATHIKNYIVKRDSDKKYIDYAKKVKEYYNTELAIKVMRGVPLTSWEESYKEAMKCAQDLKLSSKQVYLIAKLQHLYEYQIKFNWLSRNYTSTTEPMYDSNLQKNPMAQNTGNLIHPEWIEQRIKFIAKRSNPQKNKLMSYLFVNEHNNIVEINIDYRTSVGYFETILQAHNEITIAGSSWKRTVFSENFTYHRCTQPKVTI